jgi:hypothetical protein
MDVETSKKESKKGKSNGMEVEKSPKSSGKKDKKKRHSKG